MKCKYVVYVQTIFIGKKKYFLCRPYGFIILGRITIWLLLFLEYEFTIVYKLGKTHVVVDVLSKLPDIIEPLGVLDHYVL